MRELILVADAVLAVKAAATPSSTSDEEDTPMSAERDIVERLQMIRGTQFTPTEDGLVAEAAAEITRLREALAQSPEDAEWPDARLIFHLREVEKGAVPLRIAQGKAADRLEAIANRLSGVREVTPEIDAALHRALRDSTEYLGPLPTPTDQD